jgi:CBS domain-containing protein
MQMKIKDIMTREPATCSPTTNLATAAKVMLDADCGILPVVDDNAKLVGIVTDRDMYIALATRNRLASEVNVGEVARLGGHTRPTMGRRLGLAASRPVQIRRSHLRPNQSGNSRIARSHGTSPHPPRREDGAPRISVRGRRTR